jgi:hypothetical protein
VCVFAYNSRTDKSICNKLESLFFEIIKRLRKIKFPEKCPELESLWWQVLQKPENLSSFSAPVSVVFVGRKLSAIKEQATTRCVFRRTDYRERAQRPKSVLGSSLGECGCFCPAAASDRSWEHEDECRELDNLIFLFRKLA